MSLAQLSQLLPLPDEELGQVLDYAATFSKSEAADHFHNLFGDSPLAVDFIASFNAHRTEPPAAARFSEPPDAVPKTKRAPKKKPAIHTPEARRVDEYAGRATTAYTKKDHGLDYIAQRASAPSSSHVSRSETPVQVPAQAPPKLHTATAGYLISEPPPKAKAKSNPSSRSSTPKPPSGASTRVSIAGGTSMAGQSTALVDLDAAIRTLEMTTDLTMDSGKRHKCNCVGTKHPLQSAAPNCLSCGKVICMKEGLGPCTFCGSPLLSPDQVQAMLRELKDERGRERMAASAAANRRVDVSNSPAPFTQPRAVGGDDRVSLDEAAAKARVHRDKLLDFQAHNARRTTVRDEAADFDVSGAMAGTGSMWASPKERARELKRQHKLLREADWNAAPDYEKRRQVISIDLVGGKVVRKMAAVERPATLDDDESQDEAAHGVLGETTGNAPGHGTRAFSRNPLLGGLMRPVFQPKGMGKGADTEAGVRRQGAKGWRRVQDDLDDNEEVMLDGGARGHLQA